MRVFFLKGDMRVNIPTTSKPRIIILGGGFAGIKLAQGLKHAEAQVLLIDKNNYHTFQPLLYQVSTAMMEAGSIAYPFREIFGDQDNFLFRMADVLSIKPQENRIETSIGDISYEHLVVAVGSKTNYFGMQDIEENVIPMKSIPEAIALRNLILSNFEKALLMNTIEEREGLMNIVIAGGGPTGVEMAGALGELKRHVLPKDFPELDLERMQIHIVDMEDRLLRTMSVDASRSAEEFLKKFNVNIWLNTKIVNYDGRFLTLSNGKKILSDTVIWAAGVTGAVIPGLKPESIIGNRIKVDAYSKVEGYNNIYAIGDVAAMVTEKTPRGHPMVAPVAVQQARLLARNFRNLFSQKPLKIFVYKDFGVMATIGRNHAVIDLSWVRFRGILAWFFWLFVHLMALVGFRNRIVAFVNWAWNYFSYDRGLRLIIRPFIRK